MRLYQVEEVGLYHNDYFYWAENENDAIDQHRKQTGTGAELIASAVWANNKDKAYRGYVVEEGIL